MLVLTREYVDPWVLNIAAMAFVAALWTALLVRSPHQTREGAFGGALGLVAAACAAAALAAAALGTDLMALPAATFLALTLTLRKCFPSLSLHGASSYSVEFMGLCTGTLWTVLYIDEVGLPAGLEIAAAASVVFGWLLMAIGSFERIARQSVFTHASWKRPFKAENGPLQGNTPRVSIHLPTYAEPPELVKATMDRLAALDYDNVEVLVCDNNTRDERLWRPLERHARRLNAAIGEERFRFFHVSPLPGAKAGALNFLISVMDPKAELIAVVDADYQSEADFLSRLAPFFADPEVGYLQTPHDYRDFENSRFQRACYWEYMPNNKVDLPGVHEFGGAFTIGTMCLIRTEALRIAGGWAEWCLTEDSEVSVRLRAAGYRGIYIGETFGRGLVPENFADYKKQRFRWTAGPVQQLVRHWRLFLPQPFAPALPGWSKVLEVMRCAAPLQALAALLIAVTTSAGMVALTASDAIAPLDIPDLVWTLLPIAAATFMIRTWHRYRLAGCHRIRDMVAGEIARASLSYVILVGGVAGLSGKPLQWRRTPKFADRGSLGRAISAALPETLLGTTGLIAALAAFFFSHAIGKELGVLLALGFFGLAVRFLCAPALAALAEVELLGRPATQQTPRAASQSNPAGLTGGEPLQTHGTDSPSALCSSTWET